MDHTTVSKGIKWNNKKYLAGLLIIACICFYGYTFLEYTNSANQNGNLKILWLVLWLTSMLILYLAVINGQKIFIVPEQNIPQSERNAAQGIAQYVPQNGDKRPLLYLIPFIVFLVYLTFSVYIFIPWIQVGMVHFDYDDSQVFTLLLMWVTFFPPSIAYLLNRYLSLASFITFHPSKIVIRHRFTTYYLPIQNLKDILIYTRGGKWAVIYFMADYTKAVVLNMRFLRPFTNEIKKNIDSLYSGKTQTKALKRQPNPLVMSSHATGQRVTSSRGRW